MLSLYRYFKPVAKKLPDPDGPSSKSIPPSSIQAANDAYIDASRAGHSQSSKRGSYVKLTGVQQAEISKYALANGNKAAICHYSKKFCVDIPKSSVSNGRPSTFLNSNENEQSKILNQVAKFLSNLCLLQKKRADHYF